jgi:hypothetical protein
MAIPIWRGASLLPCAYGHIPQYASIATRTKCLSRRSLMTWHRKTCHSSPRGPPVDDNGDDVLCLPLRMTAHGQWSNVGRAHQNPCLPPGEEPGLSPDAQAMRPRPLRRRGFCELRERLHPMTVRHPLQTRALPQHVKVWIETWRSLRVARPFSLAFVRLAHEYLLSGQSLIVLVSELCATSMPASIR